MSILEISPRTYWVGAIDWDLRFCGSYTTPRGTTYNSYLIVDEKIALIDSVKKGFEHQFFSRIREIVDPAKIDYVICQHAEQDHAGAMPDLMKVATRAKVIATGACKGSLKGIYGTDWDAKAVKTGDEISLGKKTLMFIPAPMLHWPDNLFTYLKEDKVLFTNDAFGQHIATVERFYEEVGPAAMEEATKYFAVIVSVYSSQVEKKIKEIEDMKLDIRMIAPSHGVIWRKPGEIINAYKKWSSGEVECKVTLVFDTMWHNTEMMAHEIARGILQEGVKASVYNLRSSDWSVIIKDVIESRILLIGSPTLNMGMYPTVGGFITFLKGIRPPNKKVAAFGSYGWGRGAVGAINEELSKINVKILDGLEINYTPDQEGLAKCFEFGRSITKECKL